MEESLAGWVRREVVTPDEARERAGGVLRYQVASDARVLFSADPDVFPDFWFRAVSFWCDMRPILEAGRRDVLDRIAEKAGR